MLHFVENEHHLSQMLYVLSQGSSGGIVTISKSKKGIEDNSWPLMCVAIGMTKHAIDALRSGNLTKECSKRKCVLDVLNEFHHACFYCFYK
jgi:hypothetical protein